MRLIIGNVQTPANPLLRAISLIVGALVFFVALFFGAVLLAFVIGVVVVFVAIAAVRVWWIRRKLRRGGTDSRTGQAFGASYLDESGMQTRSRRRIIEGEFSEVTETSEDTRERRESR